MRRRLAFVLAASALAASSARAEPLDLDLTRLGPPTETVWAEFVGTTSGTATLALESRQRFAVLSTQLALALSSAILQPASTTGHSGFDVGLEIATMGLDAGALGGAIPATTRPSDFSNQIWPSGGSPPGQLYMPSVHVRKALPFSFEFGGRMIYLAQSSYFAAQGEAKWALNEGFEYIPDFAVRVAYTRLFGQSDWNLGTTDLDLMVSKRWGMANGVTSVTPYLAARYTHVSASSDRMDFASRSALVPPLDPVELDRTQASFPKFSAGLYRTTVGLRFTAYAVSLAAEATYFGGASPSSDGYDDVELASAFGGAAKLGWEF